MGLSIGLLAVAFSPCRVDAAGTSALKTTPVRLFSPQQSSPAPLQSQSSAGPQIKRADFEQAQKSPNARRVADWVVTSGDNGGLPFAIVDKLDARVFVFDADGRLRGTARVLLGITRGDQSYPGIGNGKLSDMRRDEETTPAGRFLASMGHNWNGKEVLWVDYSTGISLHRVLTDKPSERRLQRLATSTPLDKRISHGCINVPVKFFDSVVIPTFTGTSGIVYVLPDTLSNRDIFTSYYEVD